MDAWILLYHVINIIVPLTCYADQARILQPCFKKIMTLS